MDWKQLEADRDAGTPGPWEAALERGCHGVIAHALPKGGANFVCMVGNDTVTPGKEPIRFANARRIARAPDLEALALAGRKLAEAMENLLIIMPESSAANDATAALKAWRKAEGA